MTRPIPARAQIAFLRRRYADATARGDSDTAPRFRGSARAAAQGGADRASAVEVLEVRRVNGTGSLKAFAKLRLGCIVIHGVKVIEQSGQDRIALPQVPVRAKADGAGDGWRLVIEITNRAVLDQLRDAVLAAWRAG